MSLDEFTTGQVEELSSFLMEHNIALSKRINEIFQFADREGKGSLSWKDYKIAMVALTGRKPYKWEMMETFQGKKSNRISNEVFQKQAIEKWKQKDHDTYLREIFLALDNQWKGYLTFEDLEQVHQQLFPHLPTNLVKEAFYDADKNLDGRVGYKEFYSFLTGQNISCEQEYLCNILGEHKFIV